MVLRSRDRGRVGRRRHPLHNAPARHRLGRCALAASARRIGHPLLRPPPSAVPSRTSRPTIGCPEPEPSPSPEDPTPASPRSSTGSSASGSPSPVPSHSPPANASSGSSPTATPRSSSSTRPASSSPPTRSSESMRASSLAALDDADVIIHLVDAARRARSRRSPPPRASTPTARRARPSITRLQQDRRALRGPPIRAPRRESRTPSSSPRSPATACPALLDRVRALLPEHPFYYDAGRSQHADHALLRGRDDPRDGARAARGRSAVQRGVRDRGVSRGARRRCTFERCSMSSATVRSASSSAPADRASSPSEHVRARKIEALLGSPVYLDLHVKVLPNWRRDSAALRRLGYRVD